MMLIRSDSGQLMLVSQQVLAQAHQAPRGVSGQAPRIVAQQVRARYSHHFHSTKLCLILSEQCIDGYLDF